jgi:hypothetical protein
MNMSLVLAFLAMPHFFSWVRLDDRMSKAVQKDSTTFDQLLTEGLGRDSDSDKKRVAVRMLVKNSHLLHFTSQGRIVGLKSTFKLAFFCSSSILIYSAF